MKELIALVWKNFKLQSRASCPLYFQIGIALLLALILYTVQKTAGKTKDVKEKRFFPKIVSFTNGGEDGLSVAYVPMTDSTNQVMGFMRDAIKLDTENRSGSDENFRMKGFDTKADAIHSSNFTTIILFKDIVGQELPKNLRYSLLFSNRADYVSFYVITAARLWNFPPPEWPKCNEKDTSLLPYLQMRVTTAVAQYWSKKMGKDPDSVNFVVGTKCFPLPAHDESKVSFGSGLVANAVYYLLILEFSFTAMLFTRQPLMEKENKIKEALLLLGISEANYWLSWLINYLINFLPIVIIVSWLFGNIMDKVDTSVIFVLLFVYGVALISFCSIMIAVAPDASSASILTVVAFMGLAFSYSTSEDYITVSRWSKYTKLLSFNSAFYLAVQLTAYSPTCLGIPVTWATLFSAAVIDDNISIGEIIIFLVLDVILYFALAWYITKVMPGEAGVARKPWFLCEKSYYNCGQVDDSSGLEMRESRNAVNVNKYFEKDPANLTAGIEVLDVRKVFGLLFSKKVAVDSVSINFFQDQITVLLGHNGAGKTTLMSIIAGFLSPSRGTVILNGFDISKHMKEARKRLGLCPQFNILYETLTVHEHLKLFALLKGLSCLEMKTEISRVAAELGLSSLLKRKAGKLSGGQQRMLSLALALLGDPKVVILDEPSAGMDVGKRQECWNVLRRARVGRTILMTTHYMDEAEAMGDRIAIMVEGRVVCCGTALYLRKAYGAGYHLLFCLKPGYDSQVVLRMIKKYIPAASLESEVHGDVIITLPRGAEKSLPTMLKSLEENREELGISDLGMAATTMEEIFLKAGTDAPGYVSSETSLKENNSEPDSASTISNTDSSDGNVDRNVASVSLRNEDNKDNSNNPGSSDRIKDDLSKTIIHPKAPVKLQGLQLLIARVVVLLFKRQKMAAAEWIKTLCQIVGPIIVAFLALDHSNSEHISTSERSLTLAGLPRMRVPYKVASYGHQKQIDMTELYGKQFNDLSSVTMEKVDQKTGFDDYALNKITDIGLPEYLSHMIIGFEALDLKLNDTDKPLESAIAYYSPLPVRAREISVNYALNAMFQTALDETHSIQASIGLFERPKREDDEMMTDNIMAKILGIFSRFKINFVLAFLPILAAYFAGLEKKLGSRHLQALSGAAPALYWLTSLVWDLIFLLICDTPVFATIIWMTYGGLGIVQWSIMFLCFTVHGTAILSIAYLSNCFLKSPTSVVIICLISSILIGCIGSLVYSIATIVQKETIAESSRVIAMATSPSFNMGKCFENIWMNKINGDKCRNVECISGRLIPCCYDEAMCKKLKMFCSFIFIRWGDNYFAWDDPGVGPYLLAMFLQTVGFFLLMLLIESRILHKLWSITETKVAKVTDNDSDVAEERARVEATLQGQNTDVLTIHDLYKCYGTRIAVNCVTSGVMSGECFGLLGQNGAGKTSIFKCLTGATHPTSGKIKVMGVNLRKAKDAIGYCPQFQGLIPSLTGRDQIALYARLRGFTKESIQETSNWLGKLFLFEELLDLPCRVYSGGNKRKLNCAIAMVGEPSLLLLDEPSWGMDPQARRHMWDALKYARDHGSTLVLSSHSMEECEALITRMVIMKNGTFRAMGSIQHVKSKFKEGYTLTLQLTILEDGNVPPIEPVDQFITTNLPKTEFLEQRDNYLTYRIHDVEGMLGDIFEILEKNKKTLGINNYQVQQTTLEQVFIALTHTEEEPLLDMSRKCAARIGL